MPRHMLVKHVIVVNRRAYSTSRPYLSRPIHPNSHKPPTTPSSNSAFAKSRALPWALASILAGFIGLYSGALLVQSLKSCQDPSVADLSQQKDVSRRYDDTANNFDSEVGISETLMGITRVRKRLAKQCKGDVLEISCGTGRNIGYYDISREASIDSLTFVDLSPQMIEVCKKKWDILFGSTIEHDRSLGSSSFKPGLVVRFLTASALDAMPPPPRKLKYDTVIQTMGLCSTPSPEALLLNIVAHLDTSSPEARILLLEHGRSYRDWLNNILDNSAEKHAEIHGCWFNRDIGALVEAAAQKTGLEVVSTKRRHFGTTWIYELRPSAELVAKGRVVEAEAQEQSQSKSWRGWLGLG